MKVRLLTICIQRYIMKEYRKIPFFHNMEKYNMVGKQDKLSLRNLFMVVLSSPEKADKNISNIIELIFTHYYENLVTRILSPFAILKGDFDSIRNYLDVAVCHPATLDSSPKKAYSKHNNIRHKKMF